MQVYLKKTSLFLALLIFVAMGGAALAQTPSAQTNASPAPQKPSDTQKDTSKKASSQTPAKTAKSTKKKDTDLSGSAEPDKVLYNRAMMDYKRGKYTEERLSLQTLINTYPDSEYLAKAKLATGDSYYKEGGVSNLTQSIAEYKDFITFFPFLDESAYAQMQVAMAHYRMMEKADRDTSQAQAAEQEFQTFLLKYPSNPLVPKAQQRLRNVQEVLADGEFRIATFYYLKGIRSYRAALARLNDVIERYPLYSQADRALWMAGGIYDKAERRETADQLYARIVREYPSSKYVPDAKRKLADAGVPIPNADEKAVMVAAANKSGAAQSKASVVQRGTGLIRTGPDFSKAARAGDPNLTPPDDNQSATDVLRPGAGGPTFSTGAGGGTGNSVAVEQVQPSADSGSASGSGADPARPATIQPGTTAAPTTPAESSSAGAAPSSGDAGSLPVPMSPDAAAPDAGAAAGAAGAEPAAAPAGGAAADPASNSPARPVADSKEDTTTASDAEAAKVIKGGSVATGGAPAPTSAPAATAPAAAPAATPASTTPGATAPDAQAKATSSESASQKSEKPDPSTESSSKKKKGIKKVIPW